MPIREESDRLMRRDALVAAMSVVHIKRRARRMRGRRLVHRMGWHQTPPHPRRWSEKER